MEKSIFKLANITLLFLSFSASLHAFCNSSLCYDEIPYEECCYDEYWDVDLSIYTGLIYGKSKEIVFEGAGSPTPYQKISILDWDIRNLWVMGGTIEKSFFSNSLHLTVDGWGKVGSGQTTMVDRDFTDSDDPGLLTDISKSPDTHLTQAYLIDAEICYDFYNLSPWCSDLRFGFLLGYQYSKFAWKAFGGNFDYDEGADIGSFPDGELVIAYQQKFSVPYIGLNLDWQIDCWELNLFGKYTCLAYAEDHDFHALRDATFIDKFNAQQYWNAGAKASWNFLGNAWLNIKYEFQRLEPAVGDTIHSEGGTTARIRKAAGISHYQNLYSFGLTVCF